jgi:hypothetical protein
MNTHFPVISSLFNVGGPDLLIILLLAFIILGIFAIIRVVRFMARPKSTSLMSSTPEERLRKLESMRSSGTITDNEYQEQRRRILSEV